MADRRRLRGTMFPVATLESLDIGSGDRSAQKVLDVDIENLIKTMTGKFGVPRAINEGSLVFVEVMEVSKDDTLSVAVTLHILHHRSQWES
jgi:hypothetical protein